MYNSYNTELLTEAAGVKITMTTLSPQAQIAAETKKILLKLENIKDSSGVRDQSCGFHLTKSKWDPYPWIGAVESGSIADQAGLRAGDCLLNVNSTDILGLKMKDVASLIRGKEERENVSLSIWRLSSISQEEEETGLALKGSLPEIATKLANAVSGTVRTLECPVCLESAMPPVSQCVHGHILCVDCRAKTSRCPICRVRLGQGRCLVAEKVHKIIRDVFHANNDLENSDTSRPWNLWDRLFGSNQKQSTVRIMSKNDNLLKPRRSLLTKLFSGSLEKAASTENLTSIPRSLMHSQVNDKTARVAYDFHERLSLQDRPKSASTGELSTGSNVQNNQISHAVEQELMHTSRSTLSIPPTPTWGGSTDSISNLQLDCPLSERTKCKEVITSHTLLEHLNISHKGPQIHFYSNKATLPQPLPFGSEATYLLHYAGDIFFFQQENEKIRMMNARGKNSCWQWTLHGWGNNGTEVKLRRNVANLEHPSTLLSEHIAPLPQTLSLHTIEIELVECRIDRSDL